MTNVYLDIETSSGFKLIEDAPEGLADIWINKYHSFDEHVSDFQKSYESKAALIPEFGRVTCVSIGVKNGDTLRIKCIYGKNEAAILSETYHVLNKFTRTGSRLIGHSIKNFDIPYLIKRMVINRIDIPQFIDTTGLKPWETGWIRDTKEIWQYGSFGGGTSLALLATVLGHPSPKGEMNGSEAAKAFWSDEDQLDNIAVYCAGDVHATALVYHTIEPDGWAPVMTPEIIRHRIA